MKKCNLTREELAHEVKTKIDQEYEYYKKHLQDMSFNSLMNNAGVIYQYSILHYYISEMMDTFTTKQLMILNDVETLESLVDLSLRGLPQRNAESCKNVISKYFEFMEDEQDGGNVNAKIYYKRSVL